MAPAGTEQSPAHLSVARARLPARPPPELSAPTFLSWAVCGSVLWNGQSTAPASARSSFPPSPEQINSSFFFSPFASDGEKMGILEGCMVTRGLPSSFGMQGVFNAQLGKRKKMCHCCDNCGGLVGL